MALTKDDLAILQFPFKANEHEFLKNNAYITEGAITRRIEQVDPSWSLEQISLFNRPDAANGKPVTICTMRMTINGVWRDGVGMADVNFTKDGKNEANEAEKSAATDAMKRAARLFGIGRYLLDLPGSVVNVETMRNYLVATYANVPDPFGINTPKPPPSVGNPPTATTTPQTPQNAPMKAVVKDFQVNLDKKNNPYLIFSFGDKQSVAVYSGEKFRGAGYATDGWKTKGYHELTPPAELTLVKDGKFWALDSVKMLDVFEEAS